MPLQRLKFLNTTYAYVGVENFKHYEAYEAALQGGLHLTLRYLKFLFFGPPRSGKSSARRRLLKDIINLHSLGETSISTGVAETSDVIIKKLSSEAAAVADSHEWWSMKRSNEGNKSTEIDKYSESDLGYLAQFFFQLISKHSIAPVSSTEPDSKLDISDQSSTDSPTPDSNVQPTLGELTTEANITSQVKLEGEDTNLL